ncbi:MAG: hypothetical protein F6K39_26070 [Okeania sp. SIO3B3]|nr:hypothetical protein [Okeania sp. SIO3B3]
MADEWNAEEELKPLKIKCTSTDCENDLHCFKQDQRKYDRSDWKTARYHS